ncbi:hypothetical protein Trydic_g4810, partial [Trypoxylus dichotomus]
SAARSRDHEIVQRRITSSVIVATLTVDGCTLDIAAFVGEGAPAALSPTSANPLLSRATVLGGDGDGEDAAADTRNVRRGGRTSRVRHRRGRRTKSSVA